jgi:hypothetical protein
MGSEESLTSSGVTPVTPGHEFEEALREAEALLKQADRAQERADRVLTAEVGAVAVAVAVAVIIAILGFSSGVLGRALVLIFGGLAGLVVAGTMHFILRAHLINQSKRDEQAAVDVVSLLREVVLTTDSEKWDVTQLRLVRARLSRFPIGGTGPRRPRARLRPRPSRRLGSKYDVAAALSRVRGDPEQP